MIAIVLHAVLTGHMPWQLQTAALDHAAEVAALHRRSKEAAMPWLPDLHTSTEDVAFFSREVPDSIGWVAVDEGRVLGFALTRDGWLNHLYVDTVEQGRGIGTALLAAAAAELGPGMRLWAFQRNEKARTFYARHGFEEVELTDGAGNEEREPDVLLRLP